MGGNEGTDIDCNVVKGQGTYVDIDVESQGEGDARGGGTVLAGSKIVLRAAAAEGANFDDWYIDGSKVSVDEAFTIRADESMKVTALFGDGTGENPNGPGDDSASNPGSGEFGIGDALTREQFAAVIAKAVGADVDAADQSALEDFSDADGVSDWARATMSWAVENGVVNGVEVENGARELQATRAITRAEMAAMMMNAVDKGALALP